VAAGEGNIGEGNIQEENMQGENTQPKSMASSIAHDDIGNAVYAADASLGSLP
jgi:hypothetical protein